MRVNKGVTKKQVYGIKAEMKKRFKK
jgi:hypothetical protein